MTQADKIDAAYCRLSLEDMQAGESGSIQNQKRILQQYADEYHLFNLRFFVDGGVSGVSFEREGLQEMLREVAAGRVRTVIVKDLSRLGRNYIRTLERQEYLGHTVTNKTAKISYKSKKCRKNPEDQRYVFRDTHAPLVDQDTSDRVQKRIASRQRMSKSEKVDRADVHPQRHREQRPRGAGRGRETAPRARKSHGADE